MNHLVNPPASPSSVRQLRQGSTAGFTIIEILVASALLSLFLSSLFAMNSTVLRMLRSASETVAASGELQTRIEQLRLANWTQISQSGTDAATTSGSLRSLMSIRTDALGDLPDVTERVSIGRYPASMTYDSNGNAVLPAPAFSVERDISGAITVRDGNGTATTANISVASEEKVTVRVVVNWTSWGGRPRVRELLTVVSRWGISK